MKFESFMENLYFGDLEWDKFNYTETPVDDKTVTGLIEKFKKISEDYPPGALEKLGRVPAELINNLKKAGFFGLLIPEEYGGIGLTIHQYIRSVHEIVKIDMALAVLSLAHLSIGMKGILLFGNEEQKKKYLTQAAKGDMIFCYALTEPLIGSDAKNIKTIAELSDDGKYYILNGTKSFITNANYSSGLTVFAQMDKNNSGFLGAFIVETGWEGVTIGQDIEKMGLTASSTASIQFKNVRVPVNNLIAKPGDGFKIAMTILNYGRLALGAASSGIMETSLTDMINRAGKRIQFDTPIINFELIREKIIKALAEKEIIFAMTNFTGGLVYEDPVAYVAIESSHCKLYGTNRAWETLYNAMQTAGGSGYLKTQAYEKRMRDFRVSTIFEGTSEIHSIYPPLSLARNIIKYLSEQKKGKIGSLLFLLKLKFRPVGWKIKDKDIVVKKAIAAVKKNTVIFKNLFISALIKYGKKLSGKEFLLRRMTVISYFILGLISMTAKIKYLKKQDKDYKKERIILAYFTEHVKNSIKMNNRLKPDKEEMFFNNIFNLLDKTVQAE